MTVERLTTDNDFTSSHDAPFQSIPFSLDDAHFATPGAGIQFILSYLDTCSAVQSSRFDAIGMFELRRGRALAGPPRLSASALLGTFFFHWCRPGDDPPLGFFLTFRLLLLTLFVGTRGILR